MSVDRDYNIRIKIASDNSGATDAKTALDKVGAASKETGEIGDKSAEGMFEKHHELHKLLHAIGNDAVPGMGRAFAAMASGPLGAITAIALVVELLKQNIEETNKKLDELAAGTARAFGGGDSIADFAIATQEAADNTEHLEEAMRKAADAGDSVKTRYDAEAKAIKAGTDALKEKLEAQEQADVLDAKKSGASPEVISAMEADIHARYGSRSKAVQDAADQSLQIARRRELFERQQNDPGLKQAARGAGTPANTIEERNQRQSELKATEDALGKAMGDLNTAGSDKLKEDLEKQKTYLEFNAKLSKRDPAAMKQLQNEVDQLESQTAEARAAAARDRIKELSKQIAADKQKEAEEKELQDKTQSAETENAKRIEELKKEVAANDIAAKQKTKSISQLTRELTGYDDTKTFERAAGVDTAGGMADFVIQFQQARQRLGAHQGTQADQETVKLMNLLLSTTQGADQATHNTLQTAVQAIVSHKDWMKRSIDNLRNDLLRVINGQGK